ncbi:GNAT family N-acetyltransferase [Psychroserpens sp. XS_ASV72]|uniref:GNAT family N-acetyltransferase n=1 Tax=Psychroserpens sp. XS_ASV72 TaxID=3241293 RepID=UPI0035169993
MKGIKIVNRELTSKEIEHVNTGFDKLSIEEGIALESTQQMSFVAMKDNKLVGCASGLAHKNGDRYSGWFHLTDLFIDKEFRDQGIGSDLLEALEHHTKAIGVQNIWLWTSGAATIRFYNRHGYRQFTEMENWYSDGSSRIGFRKALS